MPATNRGRDRRRKSAPAAQAFLSLAEGDADLDGVGTSGPRRAAALFLALLFLVAMPLLWANHAEGGGEQAATLPAKHPSNSDPDGVDDDGDGDGDDTSSNDVTTSAATANSTVSTTTQGSEDTDTGATNTTIGDTGTTDSTDTTEAPGMTDTGTTGGDLVVAANNKVSAGGPVKVHASCAAGCEAAARATFKLRSGAEFGKMRFKTKKVTKLLDAGTHEKLKLRLKGKARSEIADAARDDEFRRRVRVIVKLRVESGSGSQIEKLKLRLK